LPPTFPSFSSSKPKKFENLQDAQMELKYQREDIEELKNQLDQTTQTIWVFSYIFLLFAPMLYYNLFKSN
jgi:hypothetical protein